MEKISGHKGLRSQNTRGIRAQGMVEFALILPVLLLLIFGVIEFGRLMFIYSAITVASREAARYGAAIGEGSGTVQYMDCAGIRGAAKRLGSIAGISDGDITISYDHGPGAGAFTTCPPSSPDDITGGLDRVVVQLSTDFESILPLVNLPSFEVSSVAARTILKEIDLGISSSSGGTLDPVAFFVPAEQTVSEDVGTVTIEVRLSQTTTKTVTVPFATGGTAIGGGTDYSITASPVTIAPGNTSAYITIPINDDIMDEYDETIEVLMAIPTNARKGSPDALVTIVDNDDPPLVAFTVDSQSANEAAGTMTVTVELDNVSGKDISVPFSLSGTAAEGTEYTITGSPLSFPAGTTSRDITITMIDDAFDEDDKTVIIALGAPTNATLGSPDVHTATILDDDPPPVASFDIASQVGPEDIGAMVVKVQLDIQSLKDISVPFTLGGTATEGVLADYTITPSPVSLPPGTTSVDIVITVNEDAVYEPDETVQVTMGVPSNATQGALTIHTATIREVAPPPTVYLDPVDNYTVRVQLSHAYNIEITVPFTLDGTATYNVDYTITDSPVTIPIGSTYAEITVSPIDDPLDEDDETVIITMGEPSLGVKGTPDVHTVTIPDNDPPPIASFSPILHEGDEDSLGTVTFEALLDAASGKEVIIPYSLGGTAFMGSHQDYLMTPIGWVTIPAGDTSAEISITVNVETDPEYDESVVVTMQTPTNAVRAPYPDYRFRLTIRDDDACSFVLGEPSLAGSTVTWQITNTADYTILLTELSVSWDETGGQSLDSVIMNGNVIVSQKDIEQPTLVPSPGDGNFTGGDALRQIAAGATTTIEFKFSGNASGGYPIDLEFNDDATWCSVSDSY